MQIQESNIQFTPCPVYFFLGQRVFSRLSESSIEYADPSKNIAVGRDGIDDVPITDDLIGIYNISEGKYDMIFEKFIKPE